MFFQTGLGLGGVGLSLEIWDRVDLVGLGPSSEIAS